MDGWDDQAKKDSINWEYGYGHLINNNYDPRPLRLTISNLKFPMDLKIYLNFSSSRFNISKR